LLSLPVATLFIVFSLPVLQLSDAQRLNVQKETKREQWDEKMRMANQFRGLESDELQFLDEVAREEREKQRRVERQDAEELALFK
jgi:hypothetical protein